MATVLCLNFKTSYVIVYLSQKASMNLHFWNFKTSYVIVYHTFVLYKKNWSIFQNILCYCLSKSHLDRYVTDYISKHLMLLFIFIFFPAATLPSSISKHLMLLFIRRRTLNRFTTDISKHLMLLFIPEKIPTSKHSEYFKTSYVIVYPISGIYYPHRTVISKHLMLLFINDADYIFVRDEIISKHLMLLFICSIDSKRC